MLVQSFLSIIAPTLFGRVSVSARCLYYQHVWPLLLTLCGVIVINLSSTRGRQSAAQRGAGCMEKGSFVPEAEASLLFRLVVCWLNYGTNFFGTALDLFFGDAGHLGIALGFFIHLSEPPHSEKGVPS